MSRQIRPNALDRPLDPDALEIVRPDANEAFPDACLSQKLVVGDRRQVRREAGHGRVRRSRRGGEEARVSGGGSVAIEGRKGIVPLFAWRDDGGRETRGREMT